MEAQHPKALDAPSEPTEDVPPWMRGATRRRRWLTQDALLDEGAGPNLVRLSILLSVTIVGVFVAWAAFAKLDETSITQGEVITTATLQTVQHLEGGIVESLLVHEGEMVSKDQPIARLDGASLGSELARLEARRGALLLRHERLTAQTAGTKPEFERLENASPAILANESKIFESELALYGRERAVLTEQLHQRHVERKSLMGQSENTARQLRLLDEQLRMWRKLATQGYGARLEVLGAEREQTAISGELGRLRAEVTASDASVKEYQSRLAELDNRFRNEALNKLGEVENELSELNETIAGLRKKADRLVVRSPISGVIQQLPSQTRHAVIPPGGVLAEILPVENELLVESRVSTTDIGFIRVGQPAQVKVQTYNFARFGSIEGEVKSISPTTFLDDQGNPYYKARIKLGNPFVGDNPTRNRVLPGMTVQADITTGSKTLLEYILKPIFTTLNEGFRER
ncbi:MAG: HlyD family type I secretion periplasmic adaptor subunit [Gammaproteobacteria bacterium]|nr:HlyD family type I secretion periplasmic adaptor subunit [Gammaproteobacteria bacterium]